MTKNFIKNSFCLLLCLGLFSCFTTTKTGNTKVELDKAQPLFSTISKDCLGAKILGVVKVETTILDIEESIDSSKGWGYHILLEEAQKKYPNAVDVVNITKDETRETKHIFMGGSYDSKIKYIFTGVAITYE